MNILYLTDNPYVIEAIIFIPPIIVIGVIIAGLIGWVLYLKTKTKYVKGTSIVVLGMQGAGKTEFLNKLNPKIKVSGEGNSTTEYDSFDISVKNKTKRINRGKDIVGSESMVRPYYAKLISESDIIFFMFDSYRYLNDNEYRKNTNARIDFINNKIEGKSHAIIGTHFDLFPKNNKKEVISKIQGYVLNKPYEDLFHENFFVIDATKKDLVFTVINSIIQ